MSKTKLETRLEKLAAQGPKGPAPVIRPIAPHTKPQREPRVPAFKHGALQFGGNSVSCMILDLSNSGARVSLGGAVNLPESLRLSIPQHALKVDATVRWQRGTEAGLSFSRS